MATFTLNAHVTVSAYTKVEADTLEEAIEIAESREARIAGYGDSADECWLIEDADGTPYDITDADA